MTEHPLKTQLPLLPHQPGVYRYLDGGGGLLYVGKAKDLRKRVSSYFANLERLTPRIQTMIGLAQGLEWTVTTTGNEALLLEANLIKAFQPRYNVFLRDDKSYPYLRLESDHPFPRLTLYRGDRREPGRYFGPYPSSSSVRETLKLLQRLFPIRQCDDAQFAQRKRPCLQYQIRRCSGPCCGKTTREVYGGWIQEVCLFLEGKDTQLVEALTRAMWGAAERREYEEAALLRDRIQAIAHVQERRRVNLAAPGAGGREMGDGDLDVAAAVNEGGGCCIQVFFIRGGINLGNRAFFPRHAEDLTPAETLAAFVPQFYQDKLPPPEILFNATPEEEGWLRSALAERRGGAVTLRVPQRGPRRDLILMAEANAREALARELRDQGALRQRLEELGEVVGLASAPERVEVFDISHLQGGEPVGGMIVLGPGGFRKDQYRKYGLKDLTLPDDTARMEEVLTRRFLRLKKEEEEDGEREKEASGGEEASEPSSASPSPPPPSPPPPVAGRGEWPELVVVDGGLPQLNAALRVAGELQLTGVAFVALAKGPERNAGRERLFIPGLDLPLSLPANSPVLFLLQNIRDEAHRFAIGFHRQRRGAERLHSGLDDVPGVGPARKKALLRHFGSLKGVREAEESALAEVPGLPRELAKRIFRHFRGQT
ncbi:MAG: excinuclease ABC subunit UvrC [Magnetococcales bacterium]|nr:excinuclease ABC subunit UvrC [Magnetococcales bacterium]